MHQIGSFFGLLSKNLGNLDIETPTLSDTLSGRAFYAGVYVECVGYI